MPKNKSKKNDQSDDSPIVIEVGHKECPPIVKKGFRSIKDAEAWLKQTHCTGKCEDNGSMIIGFSDSGSYDAFRFCTPK